MSLFLVLMILGLTGLIMMAIPAFGRHAHVGTAHGIGHTGHGGLNAHAGHAAGQITAGHASGPPGTAMTPTAAQGGAAAGGSGAFSARFLPSPRAIFSVLTLYGAFGNAFVEKWHIAMPLSAVLAAIPALLIERFLVTPLWNMLFSFQGTPCSPLEQLVMTEAEAVTPFRNGKGVVSVVHDGRMVQLTAHLPQTQAAMPVRVGDKLQIEDVDSAHERVTVSVK